MILVFGSVNVDLVASVEAIPRPGETVLAPRYERFFGGKGANQAVAASRMQLPDATPVIFCGAVGADAFGRDCLANLKANGIDITASQTVEDSTGCAFISVDRKGENAITVASGANARLSASCLCDDILTKAGVVVLQMEVPWQENASIAKRVRAAGGRTVLNFAPARTDIPAAELQSFLSDIDLLVLNEFEAEALGSTLGLGSVDTGSQLSERFGTAVVVTLGADGAKLYDPGRKPWHANATKVAVVDTTGAGDTFVGVLAGSMAEGFSTQEAVRRAGIAASLSCSRVGAQGGSPTRVEYENQSVSLSRP